MDSEREKGMKEDPNKIIGVSWYAKIRDSSREKKEKIKKQMKLNSSKMVLASKQRLENLNKLITAVKEQVKQALINTKTKIKTLQIEASNASKERIRALQSSVSEKKAYVVKESKEQVNIAIYKSRKAGRKAIDSIKFPFFIFKGKVFNGIKIGFRGFLKYSLIFLIIYKTTQLAYRWVVRSFEKFEDQLINPKPNLKNKEIEKQKKIENSNNQNSNLRTMSMDELKELKSKVEEEYNDTVTEINYMMLLIKRDNNNNKPNL